MKTIFSIAILFCLSLTSFGQVQFTDQPIEIVNDTDCVLRFIVYCSSNGVCDPSNEDYIQDLTEQALAPYTSGYLSQCSGSYPYFAFIEFTFDGFVTTHFVGFDPDLGNDCAGLVDCDDYNIPYDYPVGSINENCIGQQGEIRVNGWGPSQSDCKIWFTDHQ